MNKKHDNPFTVSKAVLDAIPIIVDLAYKALLLLKADEDRKRRRKPHRRVAKDDKPRRPRAPRTPKPDPKPPTY